MSKVWEDGEIRDATQEEQAEIDSQGGGGTSRLELVKSGTIENTTRVAVTLENYDEVYVVLDNLTGSGNLAIQVTVATTTTTTTRLSNFLSNTAKQLLSYLQRVSETDFINIYKGTNVSSADILRLATVENVKYEDKITKVTFACTGTDSIIASGNYKIYGRNLVNI